MTNWGVGSGWSSQTLPRRASARLREISTTCLSCPDPWKSRHPDKGVGSPGPRWHSAGASPWRGATPRVDGVALGRRLRGGSSARYHGRLAPPITAPPTEWGIGPNRRAALGTTLDLVDRDRLGGRFGDERPALSKSHRPLTGVIDAKRLELCESLVMTHSRRLYTLPIRWRRPRRACGGRLPSRFGLRPARTRRLVAFDWGGWIAGPSRRCGHRLRARLRFRVPLRTRLTRRLRRGLRDGLRGC